jgi:hypothetical protein
LVSSPQTGLDTAAGVEAGDKKPEAVEAKAATAATTAAADVEGTGTGSGSGSGSPTSEVMKEWEARHADLETRHAQLQTRVETLEKTAGVRAVREGVGGWVGGWV